MSAMQFRLVASDELATCALRAKLIVDHSRGGLLSETVYSEGVSAGFTVVHKGKNTHTHTQKRRKPRH
jgi:hypothetical protein